jgi:hypothetical protein
MLKIIVMIMMVPITLYQSAVKPSYFPANMKLIYEVLIFSGLKFTLSKIIMTPIFRISKNDLLKV